MRMGVRVRSSRQIIDAAWKISCVRCVRMMEPKGFRIFGSKRFVYLWIEKVFVSLDQKVFEAARRQQPPVLLRPSDTSCITRYRYSILNNGQIRTVFISPRGIHICCCIGKFTGGGIHKLRCRIIAVVGVYSFIDFADSSENSLAYYATLFVGIH